MSLQQHLDPLLAPKRMLALDGGGVRGILTLQYLAAIEDLLRTRYKRPNLVLSDYFDLIGGTSTGAIIAGALAMGKQVSDVELLYRRLAALIFKRSWFRLGIFRAKFTTSPLEEALKETYLADTALKSSRLVTGLLVAAKRMDTGSTWILTNNPRDPYFAPELDRRHIGNGNMLLWQVVRASTAAPHYFGPQRLAVGSAVASTGEVVVDHGEFVDGGVSTSNNPSMQMLKAALLEGFAFGWQPGADKLLLISVGTAARNRRCGPATGMGKMAGAFAAKALVSIMDDCADDVETMLQWFTNSPTARPINGQMKTLANDNLTPQPLLSYARYNVQLESSWMESAIGVHMDQSALDALAPMDQPATMDALAQIGMTAAAKQVASHHFPAQFDI